MRKLIVLLLFLILSVWAGVYVINHPGYLLLVTNTTTTQMPLWFALLVSIIGLLLFYMLINTMDAIQLLWYRFKNWLYYRREHRAYDKTQQGMAKLIEHQWEKAERLLLAGVNHTTQPLMNYLGAARAAQALKAIDRRNRYIKKAYEVAPRANIAIGLLQAELEMEQGEFDQARLTLKMLRHEAPKHPRVLALLKKVLEHFKDWEALLELLPSLYKAKALNADQYAQLEQTIYIQILGGPDNKSLVDTQSIWQSMPRGVRKNPDVVCAYVKQLLRFSDTRDAEELIRKTLRHHWQPELVKMYGTLPFVNINRQLTIAGDWLKQYGQKPELLLTLGRLCMRIQLWGKAKDYFEKCLALGSAVDVSSDYRKLQEQLEKNYGIARHS